MDRLRILLVDDEPHILSALSRQLRHHFRDRPQGVAVETESDPANAIDRLQERAFAVIVSDYRMPGLTGVDVLSEMRRVQPQCARIMLSGQVDRDGLAGAINAAQVQRFIPKPWSDTELVMAVEAALMGYQRECAHEELVAQRRLQLGEITPQEVERQRLESLEPGITQVTFDTDGAFVLEPL